MGSPNEDRVKCIVLEGKVSGPAAVDVQDDVREGKKKGRPNKGRP